MINLCQKWIENSLDLLIALAGHLLKTREESTNLKKTGDTSYIHKDKLDKACFQHDMAYGNFKDLERRTASDRVLRDKAFNIAKNPKYDGYQRELAFMVYKCFDKKSAGSGVNTHASKSAFNNEQLAEELNNQLLEKLKKE